nr:class I SAM-dependent methyltransferase [uncultured Allomuricauda sp.]
MTAKYDKIGVDYNLTRKADPYLTQQLLYHLQPTKNGRYLDIGCGTGNYTHAFQKKGYDFMGVDPSKVMLDRARRKNQEIVWKIGSAENTGLLESSFDGIIGSLTIHHWTNLELAFLELFKILKPNRRIVILTSTPIQMKGYWLNHYFPKMLLDSIVQMPSMEQVKEAITLSGFEFLETHKYFIQPNLEDHFLYCGKHNPELYFDERIRSGISSFSSLSNRTEVKNGLLRLREDIDSGEIKNVMKTYENDFGDYLFIIGKTPLGPKV